MRFLFRGPKITEQELQRCLEYLEAELKLIAFQDKESWLYHRAWNEWSVAVSSQSKGYKVKEINWIMATERLQESANEILNRRISMTPIPSAGSVVYFAFQEAYYDYSEWAKVQAIFVRDRNKIRSLDYEFPSIRETLQQLAQKSEQSRNKALKEMDKFLKRLKISESRYQSIYSRAVTSIDRDNW